MGRVAFSLADKLKFMPREALDWRLTSWLKDGCEIVTAERLKDLSKQRVLLVVGEVDEALPSTDEAERLQSIISNSEVHIVDVSRERFIFIFKLQHALNSLTTKY